MSPRRERRRGGGSRHGRQQSPPRPPSYPLPKDTVAAWRAVKGRGPLNAGLVFDRFVAYSGAGGGAKSAAWKELVQVVNRGDADMLAACLERWRAMVRQGRGREFALCTDWRLVSGLGKNGPLEVGFAFSHHGFAILPGSGLKGLTRAWGLRQVARAAGLKDLGKVERVLSAADEWEKEWREDLGEVEIPSIARDFRAIFGTQAAAGRAIFFDGMPKQPARLDLDIMNPHFPRYYRGEGPPTDDQNPSPVNFLAVAPGSEFVFAVGWRGRWDDEGARLRELAEEWLRRGLVELGAGAKTSAGYGYFVASKPKQPAEASAGRSRQ